MPNLSFSTPPKRKRGDWGTLFIYIMLVAIILMAATFAGGSIALTGLGHSQNVVPQPVIIQGSFTNSTSGPN